MQSFHDNTLAELDSPSRIFRTDMKECSSPLKLKVKEFFATSLFLNKRESMQMDDFFTFNEAINEEFFLEPLVLPVNKEDYDETTITRSSDQHINETSTIESKVKKGLKIQNMKNNKSTNEPSANFEVKVLEVRKPEANLLLKNNNIEELPKTLQSPVNNSVSKFKSTPIKVLNTPVPKNKCLKNIQQQNDSSVRSAAKKKSIALYNERNQLKSRIIKVSTFWKGFNNFIPSVFRLISFQNNPAKQIIEYQDFSLKGLSHDADESNILDIESKFCKEIDLIEEEYFIKDDDSAINYGAFKNTP